MLIQISICCCLFSILQIARISSVYLLWWKMLAVELLIIESAHINREFFQFFFHFGIFYQMRQRLNEFLELNQTEIISRFISSKDFSFLFLFLPGRKSLCNHSLLVKQRRDRSHHCRNTMNLYKKMIMESNRGSIRN